MYFQNTVKVLDSIKPKKLTPLLCSDLSEGIESQCLVSLPLFHFKEDDSRHCDSLGFARTLVTESKERSYNPSQSLELLSCGSEVLKRKEYLVPDLFQFLRLFVGVLAANLYLGFAYSGTPGSKRKNEKKVPEENDNMFNLINQVKECTKKPAEYCCDGEDSNKNGGNGKETQGTSSASSVASGVIPKTFASKFHGGKSNGDDDDDDEDEHRKRRNNINDHQGNECYPVRSEKEEEKDDDDDDVSADAGDELNHNNSISNNKSKAKALESDDSGVDDGIHFDDMSSPSSPVHNGGQEGRSSFAIVGLGDSMQHWIDEVNGKPHHTPKWSKKARPEEDTILQSAFKCNTEEHGLLEKCNGCPCYEIHVLLKHSKECTYRVLGGCKECLLLAEIYIYHVQHCKDSKCIVSRCSEIAEHLQKDEKRVLTDWGYPDDQVFFGENWGVDIQIEQQLLQYQLNQHESGNDYNMQSAEISQQEIKDLIDQAARRSLSTVHQISLLDFQPEEETCQYLGQNCEVVARGVPHHVQDLNELLPKVTVLVAFDKSVLSVQNGRYDEGLHWRKVQRDRAYLGQGAFGKVYLNLDVKTNKLFATKNIPERKFDPNELRIWQEISGKNIRMLSLYGAVKIEDSVAIFMEYMDGGSISQLMYSQPDGCLDDGTARYIIREVLEALAFLHSVRIIYCDIKGDNILVNSTLTRIKLGDYGSAVHVQSLEEGYPYKANGTEHFMSPEACRGERVSFSTDIWGVGIFGIEMLTGKPPLSSFTGSILYRIGTLKEPPPVPEHLDPQTREMLKDMLALNPSERPSAKELLGYPQLSEENCPPPFGSDDDDDDDDNDNDDDKESMQLPNGTSSDDMATPLGVPLVDNLAAANEGKQSVNHIDEDLQQLQEDCLLSLSLTGTDVSEFLPKAEGSDVHMTTIGSYSYPEHLMYDDNGDNSIGSLQSPFSIKALTKVEFYSHTDQLYFTVREKSSRTFGQLLLKLHKKIQDHDVNLGCFSAQLSNTTTSIDINQAIGRTNHRLVLYPASGADWYTKWAWRITSQGLIQYTDHVYG